MNEPRSSSGDSPEEHSMRTVREMHSLETAEKRRGGKNTAGFELALQVVVGLIIILVVGYVAK